MPVKPGHKNIYVHENILCPRNCVNLSKIYFLKNAKKTCKSNNRDLNPIELS